MANSSGFEGVAWAIDGARVSSDLGRLVAYAATGGGEGVIEPTDLRVVQTAGAATRQIHIAAGAAVIRNRSANAFAQSYMVRAATASHLDVGSTGSAGRSDLVVVRVKDPQFAPWQSIPKTENGPYVFPEIIPGVPANITSARQLGLNESLLALARLDIPANTENITSAMIKPLRQLAQQRAHRAIEQAIPTAEDQLNSTAGRIWPDYRPMVYVPEWTVGAAAAATISGVGIRGGSTQGVMTMVLGGPASGVGGTRARDIGYDFDEPTQGGARHPLIVSGGWSDIRHLAGQWVEVRLEARSTNVSGDTGDIWTVPGTQVRYDIQFFESVIN